MKKLDAGFFNKDRILETIESGHSDESIDGVGKKKFSVSTLTMSHRQVIEADDYESIGAG